MEALPEDNIRESRSRSEDDVRDGRATPCLTDSLGCRADVHFGLEPEPSRAGDAVTVVLPAHGRGRFLASLRAPRVAAVTLVICGAGVSFRLLRRPGDHDGRQATPTSRQLVSGRAVRRDPTVISAHRLAKASPGRGSERQIGGVRGRAGLTRRTRVVLGPRSGGRVQSGSVSSPHVGGDIARNSGPSAVDPAPASTRVGVPPPVPDRRPPCLPGTLGC
jgi:hypothetical protein